MTACFGDNAGGSTSSQTSSIAITNQFACTREHVVESLHWVSAEIPRGSSGLPVYESQEPVTRLEYKR